MDAIAAREPGLTSVWPRPRPTWKRYKEIYADNFNHLVDTQNRAVLDSWSTTFAAAVLGEMKLNLYLFSTIGSIAARAGAE